MVLGWGLGGTILHNSMYPPMQGPVGKYGRDEENAQQKGKVDVKSNFSHDHHCSIVQDLKGKMWKG